jgi:hypothetical protein
MFTRIGFGGLATLLGLSLIVGCGDAVPESTIDGGAASSSGGSSSGSSSSTGGGKSMAGSLNIPNMGGMDTGGTDSGTSGSSSSGGADGCAAANEQAELSPVYLVFLLDQSGSMGDGQNGDRTKKWDPVTAAMKSFFSDPESSGITASLSTFPLNKNKTMGAASQKTPPDCSAAAYVTPLVTPTTLPNDKTFADAITSLEPPNEYGTPTFPGLSGTITYAESLLSEDASRKVAIVMVTDGEPFACGNQGNNIDNTAMAAAEVADHIPTYVIGVAEASDNLADLNQIAIGGGTDAAFIVDVKQPEETRTALLDAINLIRGKAISCEIQIPPPPAGKRFDKDSVDVQFTPDGAASVPLKYGTDCSGDTGWRYDDEAAPTRIELCDSACSTVKADPKGKLDVVFQCKPRVVVQ